MHGNTRREISHEQQQLFLFSYYIVDSHVIYLEIIRQLRLADIASPIANFLRELDVFRGLRHATYRCLPDFFPIHVERVVRRRP